MLWLLPRRRVVWSLGCAHIDDIMECCRQIWVLYLEAGRTSMEYGVLVLDNGQ